MEQQNIQSIPYSKVPQEGHVIIETSQFKPIRYTIEPPDVLKQQCNTAFLWILGLINVGFITYLVFTNYEHK